MIRNIFLRFIAIAMFSAVLAVVLQTNAQSSETIRQDTEILHNWSGDYPVERLDLLPDRQREMAVGYLNNSETFAAVWKNFKPDEAIPDVDFKHYLVLFTRNTQFYNRISIGRVVLKDGIAEIVAMETMSAMPIEDKVGMSLAVVPRIGIKGIKAGDHIIELQND